MKTLSLRLGLRSGLILLVCVAACDTKERCVADCDGNDAADPAPVAAECEDDRNLATEFILQNNTCETLLDCVPVDGFCHPDASCGTIALSNAADLEAWGELDDAMEGSCGACGASPCGAAIMCNDAQQCEASFGSEDFCPSVEQDIETFLAANRSCETAADCKFLGSNCHVDDCSGIAVNIETSAEDWMRLDQTLSSCEGADFGTYCNYEGECAFDVICTDEGQCASDW